MNNLRKLAKNTGMLFIAQIVSYILGFFYILYTARYLGANEFGVLSLALAFTTIFGIFMDLGLNTLIIREVSKDKSLTSKYLGNAIVMKIILIIITFGLIILTSNIIGYPKQTNNIIYLISISVVFTSIYGTFNSIFQAYEKMEYSSIILILNGSLMFIGVLLAISFNFEVFGFAFIYLIVNLIIFLITLIIYIWKFSLPKLQIDLNFWRYTINDALFFGIAGIFSTIYFSINSVFLSIMIGNDAVGYYNAVYRLISILIFIPSVFMISFFPIMSRQFKNAKNELKISYEKSFKYLLITAMFIFTYGLIFADKIVLIIYGNEYIPSIKALEILIWVIPPIFMAYLLTNLLYAINKQRIVTMITGANLLLNIILNILLIPKFSFIGASAATVLTESLGLVLLFSYTSKYFFKISINQNIIKTVFSSFILIIVVYFLELYINWMLVALLGIFLYFSALFLLDVITKEDIKLLRQIFM